MTLESPSPSPSPRRPVLSGRWGAGEPLTELCRLAQSVTMATVLEYFQQFRTSPYSPSSKHHTTGETNK